MPIFFIGGFKFLMIFEDKDFFIDNIAYVNRLVTKILFVTNFLGLVFFILSRLKIFSIGNNFVILTICITVFLSLIQGIVVFGLGSPSIKNKYPDLYGQSQKFAMYFGLITASLMLGILGIHPHIGIYISYAIVIFLSCLYYNIKVSVVMSVLDYIIMLVSLYLKSINRVSEGLTLATTFHDFLAYSAGFTIEFVFVFMITLKMTTRNHRSMQTILEKNIKIENTNMEIMEFIPEILKKHEIITGYHTEHTVTYVNMICNELKSEGLYTDVLNDETIKLYSAAANLHDIGKIYIPDHILNTSKRYTPEEYEMMKLHPQKGKEILECMPILWDGRFNKIAIDMAYCHHERYDGSGYPNGLKGEEIPLCARIMAVADVADALLSRRPYKKEMSIIDTMKILQDGKGSQFDPVIVDAFVSLQPLVYMYSQDVASKQIEEINAELKWREQERESIYRGRVISEEQQQEIMRNS